MNEFSKAKIIKSDYLSFLLAIMGPVFLGIAGFGAAFGFLPRRHFRGIQHFDKSSALILCAVAAVVTVVCLVLLTKRLGRMKRILSTGPRVWGAVRTINFYKDRGRVEFDYVYEGQKLQAGAAIMKNERTCSLESGDVIEVAVDPENPRKVIVVDLFRD